MKYKIRTAVPTDEGKIRELFLEMLRTIYHTDDVKGYGDGDLDRFWREPPDRIYVAEDGQVVAFLSVEVHHDPVDHIPGRFFGCGGLSEQGDRLSAVRCRGSIRAADRQPGCSPSCGENKYLGDALL